MQRWVVCTATFDGVLPIRTLSRKPDVEDEATMASASPDWQIDIHGWFLVEDISVWMFLKVTQPKERERTIGWFWYSSCLIFLRRGDYDESLKGLRLNRNDEGRYYSPWHFIHVSKWSVEDLAQHFYNCGLRSK